jgi:hypothetical protein
MRASREVMNAGSSKGDDPSEKFLKSPANDTKATRRCFSMTLTYPTSSNDRMRTTKVRRDALMERD